MAENYTMLSDTLAGSEGSGFITRNGRNRKFYEISKVDAHVELKVAERKLLGHRMSQHKVVGASGSGSGTFYFMNSDALKEFLDYKKTGKFAGSTMQFTNEDPQSTVGRQTVTLFHVILSTIPVAYLEDDSEDPITFDSDFTFDDCDCLEAFQPPENLR